MFVLAKQVVSAGMKDLKNLVIYGSAAGLVVLILATLGRTDAISGGVKISLALILVILLPLILSVRMAKKERQDKAGD